MTERKTPGEILGNTPGEPLGKKEHPTILGMANPAAIYCQQKGGKLEAREDAQGGQYTLCHLPDGRIIEEWALFRQDHKAR